NASWTLKADLAARYICRLLNHLDAHGYTQVVATAQPGDRASDSLLNALNAGYVRRANDKLPRQGTNGPWLVRKHYLYAMGVLRSLALGVLVYLRFVFTIAVDSIDARLTRYGFPPRYGTAVRQKAARARESR